MTATHMKASATETMRQHRKMQPHMRSDVDEVVETPRAPETAEASRAPGSRSLVVAWSVAATFAFLALAIGLGLGGPQGAAGEEPVQAVTMLDLTGEEDGRAVTWTVEYDEAGAPRLAPRFVQAFGMEADAVAREKSIDRQIVLDAMEDAIARAARSRYGAETDVHAEISTKTGELRLARHLR